MRFNPTTDLYWDAFVLTGFAFDRTLYALLQIASAVL